MKLKIPIEVDFDDMKALIDDLGQLQKYKLFEGDEMVLVDVDDVANVLIKHMKAKEAQPKTGKWITDNPSNPYKSDYCKCSVCGYTNCTVEVLAFDGYSYCPNCGARMLKEGE